MYKSDKIFQIVANVILIAVTLVMVMPFILLIMASFTKNSDIVLYGYSFFPKHFSLEAYDYIWDERSQIFRAYIISIIVAVIGTSVGLMMTILYAYALSKPSFPGKKFFTLYILFTMLFNGGLVPTYIMYTRYLGIKNTIWALIIPSLLMNAFNVILVRSYFNNNVPVSLLEAGIIDGASEYKLVMKIVIPLAKPIIATIGLFIGISYWNDWMNGMYYVTNNNLYSIQQLLNNMLRNIQYLSTNANSSVKLGNAASLLPQATVRMAIAVVGTLPILIIFPFVQKYFVKGISLGAVKG
jgi:putative aldouronate transport system permease protein